MEKYVFEAKTEEELILNAPIQKNSESATLENSKSEHEKYHTFKEIQIPRITKNFI